MNNDSLSTNIIFIINKVKKIKDDLINNYFFISDFLEAKKQKITDENLMTKIASIQSKLDFAMNFSISKIDAVISALMATKENEATSDKQSINHEFFSLGNITAVNKEFDEEPISKEDSNFFVGLDFSDFESSDDILLKKRKIIEIPDDYDLEIYNKSNTTSNFQTQTNVPSDDILFIDGKINDVERKIKSDIDQLKMDNKFISDINDGLMLQIQNLTARPISNNNEIFETNTLYLTIEKNLESIINKIDELEANVFKIDNLGEKIDNLIQTNSEIKVDNDTSELEEKIDNLKTENELYKKKFLNSIRELEILKSQSNEENFYNKNNEDYLIKTSKKLENLEHIISNQIDDFQSIESERQELIKLFENKILDLQKRLNEKDDILNDTERLTYNNNSSIQKSELENYFSLLLKIEEKLNNLNVNTLKKDDLDSLKDNFVNDREDETNKIIDIIEQKNNENFLKIKKDFIDSYEKINKSMMIKGENSIINQPLSNDNLNDNLIKENLIEINKIENNQIEDEEKFNENILDKNLINENQIKWENAEKNNIIKEQCLDERILENNLIDDLETNINKLREFEKFLIDLSFEIDKFS